MSQKDNFVKICQENMDSGDCWVFVEALPSACPFEAAPVLSEIFLSAATGLENGNNGYFVGFKPGKAKEAADFVSDMQNHKDVVSVDGPNVV